MNIKISMTYSVIFVILSLFTSSMALTTCDQDDQKIMQEKFSNCTTKYKTEYNMAVALEEEEVQRLTCRLVENIVETCGEVWRQCQGLEDVRRMKDMHVESLLHKNRAAVVDIEQCDTVRQFRSRHIIYEEGPAGCSDENFTKSQTDFQTCTHSITTSVNDDIQSLNSVKSISSLLCQAISSISSDCVHHLEKCLDAEDVVIMSENHIEQLKLYFVKLAGDKADDHFHLDNCQEQSDNSVIVSKDVRNALEEDFSEEDYNFEASIENEEFQKLHNSSHAINKIAVGTTSRDIQKSEEIEKDYVNDERHSEEAVEEKPVKIVSKNIYNIVVTSSATNLPLHLLNLLICLLSLYNQ